MKIEIQIECHSTHQGLEVKDKQLLEAAITRLGTGHAPYSNFHVSVAVRTRSGQVFIGTNQENASFPVGICAERVAISVANMQAPGEALDALAVVYRDPSGLHKTPLAPCGMCRQAMREQSFRQHTPMRLLMGHEDGATWICESADALLPLSFTLREPA
ncbi:MAG TPA: cytidine deaminase [Cryomorphaceae bacterium]|jgi:cytidine deaminase|nr:MAG: hypothetical protein ABR98_01975 [Cryomorphaceae bacterium BACL7 MAG-120910-bin2]KRO68178.1 MAG: hypothetical protein ABR88_03145 [Cryomorphaceae bacterium BACL7 MAG-120322-bin74]KRO83179.1 MAG: hypothetical protein ABR87_03075 [Cryomorphaceae bacterium BACL7 MAG-121220-bin83]NQW25481.1 cytidine deaminase [Cryomorphaceae bacterium]HAB31387.1 cytidine deaminase [Cryomorphaceae bacterium]